MKTLKMVVNNDSKKSNQIIQMFICENEMTYLWA